MVGLALLEEHFLKLLLGAIVGLAVWGGKAFVNNKHQIAMLHITYIKSDLQEIKDLLKKILDKQ